MTSSGKEDKRESRRMQAQTKIKPFSPVKPLFEYIVKYYEFVDSYVWLTKRPFWTSSITTSCGISLVKHIDFKATKDSWE